MTRREALALSLAALRPLAAATSSEFWNEKKPADWTPAEVREMLTKSPWAKVAAVTMFGAPGGSLINRGGAMSRSGAMTSSGRVRSTNPNQTTQTGDTPDLRYEAVVRWESALPIREALKSKSVAMAGYYILALVGDLALADPDEDDAQRQSRVEMLKEYTQLEKHGGPIALDNIEAVKNVGTLFYFPRTDPIKDGQVTFVTKMGPIGVKCKFAVKEMMYHGKLSL